jgi:hypothetical protein
MAIEDEFAELYTKHVYKDGMTNPNSLNNPRGQARAVEYGGVGAGGHQHPWVDGVDPTNSFLVYQLGGGPDNATRDASPPSYILQHTIADRPNLEQSMIAASLIEPRQTLVNTDLRLFYPGPGSRSSSVLRDRTRIP